MTENLTRLCDCGACDTPLGDDPVDSDADGAYCSPQCAHHAGGPLPAAQADHDR